MGLPVAIRSRWPLILTGYQGWRNEQIRQRIEQAEAEGWARYLGFVPASDLPLLFSGARLFTFPSLYEGFGLPVLEAMSSGVPVVCSNSSSLPEVAGKAALMSEPLDVETLTDNLRRGLEDEHWRSSAIDEGLFIPLCFLGSAAPAKPSPCIKQWPVADAENPAFFKTYYPRTMGGIEQVIFQLAEGGGTHGYTGEVLYLSHQGSARDEPYAGHITHRSNLDFEVASTGFSVSALRDFAELAGDADIVHYHFPWPYMDLAHFLTRVRKPTVLTYHSDIVKQKTLLRLYSPLMHQFLKRVDRIVATSPNYVESSETLQRFQDKVRVIPIGLDEATYPCPTDEKLAYWRKQVGERFFLFVGPALLQGPCVSARGAALNFFSRSSDWHRPRGGGAKGAFAAVRADGYPVLRRVA